MRHLVLALALLVGTPSVALLAEEGGHEAQGERSGVCKGMVVNVEGKTFTIRSPKGEFTYIPRWIGGLPREGGSMDPDLVAKIHQLQIGDYVEVAWEQGNEHLRAVRLTLLGHPGGDRVERREERREERHDGGGDRPAESDRGKDAVLDGPGPAERCGVVRGTVTSVDPKGRFVVKAADGAEETFIPTWTGGMPADGGGFNQEMVGRIAQLKPGQQVEVQWEWSERKRCIGIKTPGN